MVLERLEIGCGQGRLLYLVDIGCDNNLNQLMKARKIARGKHLVLTDARRLPFRDECFSFVLASHVLEHIRRLVMALGEIKRILKHDGKVEFRFPLAELADIDKSHVHKLSIEEWTKKIEKYFKISKCEISSTALTQQLAGKFNFVPKMVREKFSKWLVRSPIRNRPIEVTIIGKPR
ncbi:unnamed protein product [marine sediment metagenome]|uniref:Methyltransferase type 11 domain-containing protein n=1 Tax=marine sediment metagenome TaxID=412755 RepID=X1LER2_9ZZZZ